MESEKLRNSINRGEQRRIIGFFIALIGIGVTSLALLFVEGASLFPGFTAYIILFSLCFLVFILILYGIKREYFFKLSTLFSKKVFLFVFMFYFLGIAITSFNTYSAIGYFKNSSSFKADFPNSNLTFEYKNLLTLRDVAIIEYKGKYNINESLEKKIKLLKDSKLSFEIYLTQIETDKEFTVMIAHYPEFLYRESGKLFFSIILYFYWSILYNLLYLYLQKDGKFRHGITIFVFIFPIYGYCYLISGLFHKGNYPSKSFETGSFFKTLKYENHHFRNKSLKYIDFGALPKKEHSSGSIRIENTNLYIKFNARSKR